MPATITTANSLTELSLLPGYDAALDRTLASVIPELTAPVAIRTGLENFAAPQFTLRQLFRDKQIHKYFDAQFGRHALLRPFKHWLAQQPQTSPAAPLAALVSSLGVPDLPAWRADYFIEKPIPGMPYRATVSRLLDRTHPGARLALDSVAAGLGVFATVLARARAGLPQVAARLESLPPIGQPGLDAFRRAVALQRSKMLEAWPPSLCIVRITASEHGDDLELTVRFEGNASFLDWYSPRKGHDGMVPVVTLHTLARWAEHPRLSCTCGQPACVHRALALDAVLDGTQTETTLSKIVLRLLQPAWHRALADFAAPPSAQKTEKPCALSVVVTEGQVGLQSHDVTKRGKRRHGRLLSAYNLDVNRYSGLDRRLVELWILDEQSGSNSRFLGDLLLLLESHPDVRLEPDGEPVKVRLDAAHVRFREEEEGVEVQILAGDEVLDELKGFKSSTGLVLTREHEGALVLYTVSEEVLRLANALKVHDVSRFPKEALPALVEQLPRLEAMARVELPDDLRGEERPPLARVLVRVDAAGPTVALRSEPLEGGPVFVPGQGVAQSAAFDGTRRRFTRRDFEAEVASAVALSAELGLDPMHAAEPFTWHLDPGDKALETLRRISHLIARGIAVEWQGKRPTFTRPAEVGMLSLRIERRRDWFGLDGALEVDDRRVELAALLEAARARRRWVHLGKDQYAELSDALLARLSPLAHLKGEDALPTLTLGTVPLVEALEAEVKAVDAADGWKKLTQRLADAKDRDYPVPKRLAKVLRDYQTEGFIWLSRLAEWGAGACLADDMGLGKTLQALALLVSRRAIGPALVVAPSSVLHTWKNEAERFAPELTVRFFHEEDGVLSAKAGEVVVVSWTSFARRAEQFGAQKFATAVLDEAQAIKNSGTQRAKAAHRLQADFVVALSGTPIENHVGELWSLFRAVLPALLGSEESFKRRFASSTPDAVRALAALVQPFILRRSKKEVAKELPPRTDLDVVVPLSKEERALYDDVRLAAVTELGDVTGESKRFDVLAALTRLRLAACHPRLVDAAWQGGASKLARLLELLRDLSASGHRTLVFSQFTQHLALVSDALLSEGVRFSYLDGQVPLAERQRRVEAFQAGQGGDVFLISLKAGGTGLTLTAADYIVHLDPWWNPAVEDQASDRAHRIGQDKPVTVYRLIAEGTIEQQILSLHREKRELVDALLAGADRAGKLSAKELAGLILQ